VSAGKTVAGTPETLVDAATVATYLGVKPDWVYRNAGRLGGKRLGAGPRARLRFDLELAVERLNSCTESRGSELRETTAFKPQTRQRAPSRLGSTAEFLPIRRPIVRRNAA
jgi:hypothetical protein